jgi:hypothetical protein
MVFDKHNKVGSKIGILYFVLLQQMSEMCTFETLYLKNELINAREFQNVAVTTKINQ